MSVILSVHDSGRDGKIVTENRTTISKRTNLHECSQFPLFSRFIQGFFSMKEDKHDIHSFPHLFDFYKVVYDQCGRSTVLNYLMTSSESKITLIFSISISYHGARTRFPYTVQVRTTTKLFDITFDWFKQK